MKITATEKSDLKKLGRLLFGSNEIVLQQTRYQDIWQEFTETFGRMEQIESTDLPAAKDWIIEYFKPKLPEDFLMNERHQKMIYDLAEQFTGETLHTQSRNGPWENLFTNFRQAFNIPGGWCPDYKFHECMQWITDQFITPEDITANINRLQELIK